MSNNRIEGTIPQAFASDVVQILDLSGFVIFLLLLVVVISSF